MQLNFEDKNAIIQAAQSHGHTAIIRLFRAKVDGLTEALKVPQVNVDEDVRLLQEWRGYSAALYFLESLPRLIHAELEKQQREGTFSVSPTQPSVFAVADANETPDVMEGAFNPAWSPRPAPAYHPSQFRT